MEDDYERANALEWDNDLQQTQNDSEWEMAPSSKKNQQQQQQRAFQGQKRDSQHQQAKSSNQPPRRQQQQRGSPHCNSGPSKKSVGRQQTSPRKWNTNGRVLNASNQQRRLPPPQFTTVPHNEGEASWRKRDHANEQFRLPGHLLDRVRAYQNIANDNETFIPPLPAQKKSQQGAHATASVVLGIWGIPAAVAKTKADLAIWIDSTNPTSNAKSHASFPRIASLTDGARARAQSKWARDVRRQHYRQYPAPDAKFGAIGHFYWPVAEYKADEVLGPSLEALDDMRMEFECHIVWWAEKGIIRVLGSAKGVKDVLERIKKVCFELAARTVQCVKKSLMRWDPLEGRPNYVYMEEYIRPAFVSGTEQIVPMEESKLWSPRGEQYDQPTALAQLHCEQDTTAGYKYIQTTIQGQLAKLEHYKGDLSLRVRLGTFIALKYKNPKNEEQLYELEDYEEMAGMRHIQGAVTQELGDLSLETSALAILQSATALLSPADAMTRDLKDVEPIYTAVFVFENPSGELHFTISWQFDQSAYSSSSECNIISQIWTRAPVELINMNIYSLSSGRAWQFDLLASQPVEPPKELRAWARNLKLKKGEVGYLSTSVVNSYRQQAIYRFNVVKSEYTLELSWFQDKADKIVRERRWAAQVFRGEWDFAGGERKAGVEEDKDWQALLSVLDRVEEVLA